MAHQGQHVPGPDTLHYKHVYYSGTDTIKTGYALCYDWDNITGAAATLANNNRCSIAEKPATTNIQHFAGVVAPGYPAAGVTGPAIIRVVKPNDVVCNVFTDQETTIGLTLLYLQSGTYYLTDAAYTGSTACVCVALALQTQTTADSTPRLVQARLDRHIWPSFGTGKFSSTRRQDLPGSDAGTTYGQMTSLWCSQAGGTVRGAHHRLHLTGAATGTGGSRTGGAAWVFEFSTGGATGDSLDLAALGAVMAFKSGATVGASKCAALAAKIQNIDGTPAALTGTTCVALDLCVQMNEDPGNLYQMAFRNDSSTKSWLDAWFTAEDADAIKFETVTLAQPDHGIKIYVAGTAYWICCVDHQTT